MRLCISQISTLSTPIEAEFAAYERAGWRSVEIWLTKLETYLETHSMGDFEALLKDHGLEAAGAASQGGLLVSIGEERRVHWEHFERRLEILRAIQVATLVITPDFVQPLRQDDPSRALTNLAEAARLAGRFGVRLALEFQKTSRFVASLDTAVALVTEVGSDHLGVCLDLFHYYCGPSKFEDLGYLNAQNLACVQVCDLMGAPRELALDSERIFPGEGTIELAPLLDHLDKVGYEGAVSLELMNPGLWSIQAHQVADFGHQALLRVMPGSGTRLGRSKTNKGGG